MLGISGPFSAQIQRALVALGFTGFANGEVPTWDSTLNKFVPGAAGISTLVLAQFTISDAQMRALNGTPVVVAGAAATPGNVWSLVAGWAMGTITAAGAVTVNGTLRYTGSATGVSNAFVLNAAGAGVLRSEIVSNGFSGVSGTDEGNRTLEIVGNANADGTYATVSGVRVSLLLLRVPQA